MTTKFSGEYRIAARQKQVWAALSDPAVLRACIAGCSRVDKISDSEMVATMVVNVGPFSATFKGTVALTNLSGPIGYTLIGESGGPELARIEAQVSLAEVQNETVLKYVATTDFGDSLADVGGLLVQAVSEMSADEFFAEFSRQLDATGVKEAVVPVAVAAPVPGPVLPNAAAEYSISSSPGARTPAWVVVFACSVGFVLGYGFARWL